MWNDNGDALARARAKYDKDHTTQVSLKLNLRTDQDIIKWLWSKPSKQGAIKKLIRADIERNKNV